MIFYRNPKKSLSPSEEELEMAFGILKIDDPNSIDMVEFEAIGRVNSIRGIIYSTVFILYKY